MNKVARIIWTITGVSLVVMLLAGAIMWGYMSRPSQQPCRSLVYIYSDGDERKYLTDEELNALLRAEDIYPVGRQTNRVSLQRIEDAVRHHPMVRTAECYLTPRHEMRVVISQRVPLLHVAVPGDNYFVDTDHRLMPVRTAVKDTVLLVTGAIGQQTAATQLADFAEWLQNNSYWRSRVYRVHMQTPTTAVLWLRGENQPHVLLGSLIGSERKLAKLRTFMEHSAEAMAGKQYRALDVRFRGQVIGRP